MTARVALLAVALVACSKVKREGDPPAGPRGDGGVRIAERTDLVPLDGPSIQLLRYLADDAQLAVVVDVAKLRKTPLWTSVVGTRSGLDLLAKMPAAKILAGCHFDPALDVDRLLVGARPHDTVHGQGAIIVQGRFDEAALMPCVERNAGQSGSAPLPHEQHHGRTVYRFADGQAVVFLSPSTVAQGSYPWLVRLAEGHLGTAPRWLTDQAAKIDTGQGVWFVLGEAFGGSDQPQFMAASFAVADGVDAHLIPVFKTPDEAKKVIDETTNKQNGLQDMFGTITAVQHGVEVDMRIVLTAAQAKNFAGIFDSLLR